VSTLAWLGACGAGSQHERSDVRRVVDETFSSNLTDDVLERNHDEEQQRIAECMAREGFDYLPVPPIDAPRKYERFSDIFLISVEHARRSGYGVDLSSVGEFTDPNEAVIAEMSEQEQRAYQIALYGSPDGRTGCGSEAQDETERQHPESNLSRDDLDLLERAADRYKVAIESRATEPTVMRWSDCMLDRGLRVATPFEARELAEDATNSAVAQQIAVDDAECQEPIRDDLRSLSDSAEGEAFGSS
jgi:hypothetical protein